MKVAEAVKSLSGKSADEIAALLKEWHITGRPATVGACPLARYMHGAFGGSYLVGPLFIGRWSHGKLIEKVPTPKHCAAFIRKFDNSGYPDLIAPPPRVKPKPKPHKDKRRSWKRGPTKNHPAKEVGRW